MRKGGNDILASKFLERLFRTEPSDSRVRDCFSIILGAHGVSKRSNSISRGSKQRQSEHRGRQDPKGTKRELLKTAMERQRERDYSPEKTLDKGKNLVIRTSWKAERERVRLALTD